MKCNYSEVYSKLLYETALVVFLKKNGEVRIMLGTRNLKTAELYFGWLGSKLNMQDGRCNINNGNIAVIDLIIGDGRSFNIDRILDIQYAGMITTKEQLDEVVRQFVEFKEQYEKTKPMIIDMDSFDNGGNEQ
jgi:hypothetical protein